MTKVYVTVVADREPTYILGVYPTRKAAEQHLVKILGKQQNWDNLNQKLIKEFDRDLNDLSDKDLRTLIFKPSREDEKTQEISDYLSEELQINMEEATVGTTFDFRNWNSWDDDNLYQALEMIVEGKTGSLSGYWPHDREELLLRNLD